MANQAEKLAKSLEVLGALCDGGKTAIQSKSLSRTHRERLLAAGFLQEVMKGWYFCMRPDLMSGESTSWFLSFWSFCADYLNVRFGDHWCLSPEQSLLLHAGNRAIPRQLIVRSPRGTNNIVSLPYDTSLLVVRANLPEASELVQGGTLRTFSATAALISVSADFYASHSIEARAILAQISSASEILPHLLERGQTTVAGRLAGAFHNIGRTRISKEIVDTMKAVGHDIRVSDPFTDEPSSALSASPTPPPVNRLRLTWGAMRQAVMDNFPPPPKSRQDVSEYLRSVEEKYVSDAYHSLSIEGYQVNRELIERIRRNDWNPDENETDRHERDAMAAKGYWQAFQRVQNSLGRVLDGQNPGTIAEEDHGDWYRKLFGPSVSAGIVKAADLAGYRNSPVYIRLSCHVPPPCHVVRELMPAFFALLRDEENAAVRAVLGHFFFVNIHPYMDGNGRIGRFLMNLMMASGGYPWMVVPVDRRSEYMSALEKASIEEEIVPLARFFASLAVGT